MLLNEAPCLAARGFIAHNLGTVPAARAYGRQTCAVFFAYIPVTVPAERETAAELCRQFICAYFRYFAGSKQDRRMCFRATV